MLTGFPPTKEDWTEKNRTEHNWTEQAYNFYQSSHSGEFLCKPILISKLRIIMFWTILMDQIETFSLKKMTKHN